MTTRPVEICKLCKRKAPLCESHFLPKLAYKQNCGFSEEVFTDYSDFDKSYIHLGKSDYQEKRRALCRECEDRFQTSESFVARLARPRSEKCLRTMLAEKGLEDLCEDGSTIGLDQVDPSLKHFEYFAYSVFWRASAIRWPNRNECYDKLGCYEEKIRCYLLENRVIKSPFYLLVSALVETDANHMRPEFPIHFRVKMRDPPSVNTSWRFGIPGVKFQLLIKPASEIQTSIPAAKTEFCINRARLPKEVVPPETLSQMKFNF
ncbi:MAG: hypothetical protein AAFY22_15080 [Pseudomonadota bacterium]